VKDSGTSIQSGFFAVDIDGSGGGGDAYRTAIEKWTCDSAAIDVYVGDVLPVLKGDLHGPTIQGVLDLISQDPIASWDDATRKVLGSCADEPTPCGPHSPRLAAVVAFDPAEFEFEQTSSASDPQRMRVANIVGVFLEAYFNGWVRGVVTLVPEQ